MENNGEQSKIFPRAIMWSTYFLGAGKTKFLKNLADVGVKWVEKKQDRETI